MLWRCSYTQQLPPPVAVVHEAREGWVLAFGTPLSVTSVAASFAAATCTYARVQRFWSCFTTNTWSVLVASAHKGCQLVPCVGCARAAPPRVQDAPKLHEEHVFVCFFLENVAAFFKRPIQSNPPGLHPAPGRPPVDQIRLARCDEELARDRVGAVHAKVRLRL